MTNVKQEWVVVIKGKLLPIDNCLPLLVGLKLAQPSCPVTIITPTPGYNQMLESELFLHEMVMKYGIEIRAPNVSETNLQRFRRRVSLVSFLLRVAFFQKVFFLDIQLLGNFGRFVARVNKWIHKGKSFGLLLSNMEPKAAAHWNEIGIKELSRRRPMFTTENYDGLLVSFKTEKFQNNHQLTRYKNIDVGYTRGQSQWLKEIENSKVELEMLKRFENGFIFWPLSIIKRDERGNQIFDLSHSISTSLKILKEARPEIGVVFRYHPTTERDHFLALLDNSEFQNYQISSAHPLILISRSEFVFSNIGSTVFSDAWFHRKPVVQYSPDPNIAGKHDTNGQLISPAYAPIVNHFLKTEEEFRFFLEKWPNSHTKSKNVQSEKDVSDRMKVIDIRKIINEIENC